MEKKKSLTLLDEPDVAFDTFEDGVGAEGVEVCARQALGQLVHDGLQIHFGIKPELSRQGFQHGELIIFGIVYAQEEQLVEPVANDKVNLLRVSKLT